MRPLATFKISQQMHIAYETSIIFKRWSITYGTRSLETVIGILLSYTTHRHGKHIVAETTPQTPRPSMELHQHTPRTHDNVHNLQPTPTRRALRNQSESQMNKPVPHPAHTLPPPVIRASPFETARQLHRHPHAIPCCGRLLRWPAYRECTAHRRHVEGKGKHMDDEHVVDDTALLLFGQSSVRRWMRKEKA